MHLSKLNRHILSSECIRVPITFLVHPIMCAYNGHEIHLFHKGALLAFDSIFIESHAAATELYIPILNYMVTIP